MQAYQLVDDLSSTTLCQAATKASLFFVKLIDMVPQLVHEKSTVTTNPNKLLSAT